MVADAAGHVGPPREELVIKVLIAIRLPGVDVLDIVQAHRRHVVETMHYYTRLKEDAGEHEVGLLLVADAEMFRLDAFVRWLDAAEARIRRLPAVDDVGRLRHHGRGRVAGWGYGDDRGARAAEGVEVLRARDRPWWRRCGTSTWWCTPVSWWR